MNQQNIRDLIRQYLDDSLSADELSVLLLHLQQQEGRGDLEDAIRDALMNGSVAARADKTRADHLFEGILRTAGELQTKEKMGAGQPPQNSGPVRMTRGQGRRSYQAFAAAAVLLLIAAGGYFFYTAQRYTEKKVAVNKKAHVPGDIGPGHSAATLILADGSRLTLDSAGNGMLAQQASQTVVKANGQLLYNSTTAAAQRQTGIPAPSLVYNTLSTPRGGQYQLVLPDGTRVWLNAASSITYPVGSPAKEMRVRVDGEAYFEVAKNKQLPFIVEMVGRSTVQVLGTHFNVNGYTNEGGVKTTLLEGSIKVIGGQDSKVLLPGQQSDQSSQDKKIVIHNGVDTDRVLAWKNGLFNFDGASLPAVMRQLERWYDITVQYEGAVPAIEFRGGMDRNVNLSAILQFLTEMKIKYAMQGRTLIISQ